MEYVHISIIVVSYHNPDMTARFVNNELIKLTTPFSLVIVNNDANQNNCNDLRNKISVGFQYDIIYSNENLGYARGNNLGVEFLKKNRDECTHYLFSNDDIEIKDGRILETLYSEMYSNDNIACIGPRIIGLDGRDQNPHDKYISPLRLIAWKIFKPFRKKHIKRNEMGHELAQKRGKTYWVCGAFMLVDKSKFEAINGFDSDTFLYYEEAILAERFSTKSWDVWYVPSTCVIHYEGSSTKQNIGVKREAEKHSSTIYFRRYKKVNRLVIHLYQWICYDC